MTSDRIRPMMELFRRLQLQVLLISTVEKSTAIQPYCDITYSIVCAMATPTPSRRRPVWPGADGQRAHLYFTEHVPEFFVTAEKPHLGFAFTVAAGGTNMVLDVLLVGMLHGGVEGAAIATFISQIVGGVLPVFYFLTRPPPPPSIWAAPSGTAASSAAPASTAPPS